MTDGPIQNNATSGESKQKEEITHAYIICRPTANTDDSRELLIEDFGRLWFTCTGILLCALFGPWNALIGAIGTFAVWRLRRWYIAKEEAKLKKLRKE